MSLSQITVGLRSMEGLLVRVRAYVSNIIGHRFEKVRNGHRFENLKKDIDLWYWCLWRRNQTWIWGLDVDLSIANIILFNRKSMLCLINIIDILINKLDCIYRSIWSRRSRSNTFINGEERRTDVDLINICLHFFFVCYFIKIYVMSISQWFLVHPSHRIKWAFLIEKCFTYLCPSVFHKLFTFSTSSLLLV